MEENGHNAFPTGAKIHFGEKNILGFRALKGYANWGHCRWKLTQIKSQM